MCLCVCLCGCVCVCFFFFFFFGLFNDCRVCVFFSFVLLSAPLLPNVNVMTLHDSRLFVGNLRKDITADEVLALFHKVFCLFVGLLFLFCVLVFFSLFASLRNSSPLTHSEPGSHTHTHSTM